MCQHVGDARQGQTPPNEVMQNTTHGLMGGYGLVCADSQIFELDGLGTGYTPSSASPWHLT